MKRTAWWIALGIGACRPDEGAALSLLNAPRVLAVRAEPAEAKPGTATTYRALVASPDPSGNDASAELVWNFCRSPKSVLEENIVSSACLEGGSLVPLAPVISTSESDAQGALPSDACSRFGPDTPPGGYRPRDPDVTGGYFQPLRVDFELHGTTFFLSRISCNLAQAPMDVAAMYRQDYLPNLNPRLTPVRVTLGRAAVDWLHLPRGRRLEFTVGWASGDAETYVYFDRESQTLTTKRESMRVAWYATTGAFDSDDTGRSSDDTVLETSNGFIGDDVGKVRFWVVLRDSRGGVDFASYEGWVDP